jgi:hypothetical protein
MSFIGFQCPVREEYMSEIQMFEQQQQVSTPTDTWCEVSVLAQVGQIQLGKSRGRNVREKNANKLKCMGAQMREINDNK